MTDKHKCPDCDTEGCENAEEDEQCCVCYCLDPEEMCADCYERR